MKFSTLAVAALLPFAALGAPTAPDDAAPTHGLEIVERVAELDLVGRAPEPIAELDDLVERDPEPDAEFGIIEKRAVTGTVKVDGLRYRTCPRTSCTAIGQYPKGKKISLKCFTRVNTTPVNGDK